jgi:hypothetical protein
MIYESLYQLGNNHPIGPEFLGECFSLICVASNNGFGSNGNSQVSLVRSYAWDTFQVLPRVADHAPCTVIAKRLAGKEKRITVAIEGTNSLSQIMGNWTSGALVEDVAGRWLTYKPFNDRAVEVQAALEASGFSTLLDDNPEAQVIFTGHSLGAAIAEILCFTYRSAKPFINYQLWKFGAPKVGTTSWTRNVEQTLYDTSFYTEADPMYLFPNYMPPRGVAAYLLPTINLGLLTSDRHKWRARPNGSTGGGGEFDDITNALRLSRLFTSNVTDPANPWYWHRVNGYRYTITQMLNRVGGLEAARFRYFEAPNENNWGAAYVQDGGVTDLMTQIVDPAPAMFVTNFVPPPPPNPNQPVPPNVVIPNSGGIIRPEGRGVFATPPRHRGHR